MIRNNIALRTKTPGFVEFLYPNYVKLNEFSPFIEGGVIFTGDSKYLQSFRDYNIPYIYVKGTPEYDLTIPVNLFEFVYAKWDKTPPKKVADYIRKFDEVNVELEDLAKLVWVTGKCTIEDDDEVRMSNLYSLLGSGSMFAIMEEFLKLSGSINTNKLFYSVQWFLTKSLNVSSVRNPNLQNNIKRFLEARGKNVRGALLAYLYSPADNVELKMIKLFELLTANK